ncbi:hypothetical protein pdam_00018479 [Pocillopora damicornis]|uniref:Uncharacterized protein n=1 Tax=Pocillopora damicornis TaxID=46731 RepID=A0A3M6UDU1_POCDA|nr:hypothetical protein pdam_00018479 [Pocillopora damicornis]
MVSDSFRFKFCNFRPLTRGGILSVTGSIFDPLDLCRIKLGWDDEILDEYSSRWGSWLADLLKFSIFIVSRFLKPADFSQVKYSQLHFSLFFPFWQIVFVRQDKMIKTELTEYRQKAGSSLCEEREYAFSHVRSQPNRNDTRWFNSSSVALRCSDPRAAEVLFDRKDLVRRAKVKVTRAVVERPIDKLCLLLEA